MLSRSLRRYLPGLTNSPAKSDFSTNFSTGSPDRSESVTPPSSTSKPAVSGPKYLIIDGYTEAGRKGLTDYGASTAGKLNNDS